MAKRSMIEREKKRIKLHQKYESKRQALLEEYNSTSDFNLKLEIHSKIQRLPILNFPDPVSCEPPGIITLLLLIAV